MFILFCKPEFAHLRIALESGKVQPGVGSSIVPRPTMNFDPSEVGVLKFPNRAAMVSPDHSLRQRHHHLLHLLLRRRRRRRRHRRHRRSASHPNVPSTDHQSNCRTIPAGRTEIRPRNQPSCGHHKIQISSLIYA